MTIDEKRKAIRKTLRSLVEYWDGYDIDGQTKQEKYDHITDSMLAFLSDNGVVLKDDSDVGILVYRRSDDTEVPLTAFAPLVESARPSAPQGEGGHGDKGRELARTKNGGRVVDYSAGQERCW